MLTDAEQHNQLQCLHETNPSKQSQPVETPDETCRVACRERYGAAIISGINPPAGALLENTVWLREEIKSQIYDFGPIRRGAVGAWPRQGRLP